MSKDFGMLTPLGDFEMVAHGVWMLWNMSLQLKNESVTGFTFHFLTSMKGLLYFTKPFIISQLSYLYINGIYG